MSTDPAPEAPAASYGLPRTARLRTDRDFRSVYSRGSRVRGALLTVVGLARRGRGPFADGSHRLGLSVSKEHGRAVRRNKIKRLCREAFRLERPTLPGAFDLVLIPQRRDGRYELEDLRAEIVRAVATLLRRAQSDGDRPARGDRGRSRRRGRPRRERG